MIGITYQLMEKEDEASRRFQRYLAAANEGIRAYPKNSGYYLQAGLAYGRLGNFDKAQEMADKAIALNPTGYFSYAQVLSVIGKKDDALRQLELAVENGWTDYIWAKVHVDLENLQEEARFKALIAGGLQVPRK
jgi:tetratricopeptide (TPR) repeat protein